MSDNVNKAEFSSIDIMKFILAICVIALGKGKQMKKGRRKLNYNIKDVIFFIVAALFLTISFYVSAQFNTDDAGTFMIVYNQFELGNVNYSLRALMSPWNLTLILLYFLGIGSTGSEMVIYCYAIWYFICIFLTLLIGMSEIKKNRWLLFLAVFIFIPYVGTNKNHLVPAAISLFVIYSIYMFVSYKKKFLLVIAGILSLYFFMTINDRVILLLFLAVPTLVYGIIWCLQNIDRQKILYFGTAIIVAIIAVIKVVDEILGIVTGHGLTLLEAWGGYGGESYLTWINIYNLFDKGIPSFFSSLLIQYNIPVEGGLIQFNSFFWIVRMFIVILALIALISKWIDILKKGIVNVHIIDVVSTISVTALIGVNVLNGMIEHYDIEGAPMNRYASLAWFLIVVILIRWIEEKYTTINLVKVRQRVLTSGVVLGTTFVLLIIGYSKPVYLGRNAITKEPCQLELDFLKEHGEQYKYGLASFWKSTPITAMTNGEYNASYGWIEDSEEDQEKKQIRHYYDGLYDNGCNYFNYMISYVNNDMTMSEENIEEIRGDYIEKKHLHSEDDHSIVYLYDYDIRWEPQVVMECVGTDYELTEPIEYHFEFPVGTNRIEMTASNSANFNLEVVDNPDIQNVLVRRIDDNKIYVDLVCLQNTNATFKVARNVEELTTIHKIVLKRVFAAVDVWENGQSNMSELYLKEGSYVFTFVGENLDELEVTWTGESIETEQITDGRMRRRYQVDISTPQTIQYMTSGDGVEIDRISYENAGLFEEE